MGSVVGRDTRQPGRGRPSGGRQLLITRYLFSPFFSLLLLLLVPLEPEWYRVSRARAYVCVCVCAARSCQRRRRVNGAALPARRRISSTSIAHTRAGERGRDAAIWGRTPWCRSCLPPTNNRAARQQQQQQQQQNNYALPSTTTTTNTRHTLKKPAEKKRKKIVILPPFNENCRERERESERRKGKLGLQIRVAFGIFFFK